MVSHFVRSALQQGASHRLRSCTLSIRSIHSGLNQYTSMAPLSLVRHGSSHIHYFSCNNSSQTRPFSTKDKETEKEDAPITPILVYESPFASLTLKLKRVSLTSAAIGIIGLPLLSLFYSGDVPATGQLAVVATAGVTAVGSTALLGYCFTPYVHTMEILPNEGGKVRMITRDILARRVETLFDPEKDVSAPGDKNTRPFCNFMVNEKPFYIHPDLVKDEKVRVMLVGEGEVAMPENQKKTDDDEFL